VPDLSRARRRWAGAPAVVTGAGSGLGAGFAAVAAELGMDVVLVDLDGERLDDMVRAITGAGGRARAEVADVGRYAEIRRLAEAVFEQSGPVALLVNNAGVEHLGRLWEEPVEAWHRIVDCNLNGVYHGVRAFVPLMLASGAPATVLNVASVAALTTGAYHGLYEVTKHGVLALSEVLADELAAAGAPVQVSVALPGPVGTRIYQDANAEPPADDGAGERLAGMRSLLSHDGMPPVEAARLLLSQVADGAFAVTTHPDWLSSLGAQRADRLRRLTGAAGATT